MKNILNNQLYNGAHYYPGQAISIYDKNLKKYRRVTVVTAGGGKIKIKENNNVYWIDAGGVR